MCSYFALSHELSLQDIVVFVLGVHHESTTKLDAHCPRVGVSCTKHAVNANASSSVHINVVLVFLHRLLGF